MMMNVMARLAVLSAAVLLLAGCGDDTGSAELDATSDASSDAVGDTSAPDAVDDAEDSSAADTDATPDDTALADASDAVEETDTAPVELPAQPWDLFEAGHYAVGFSEHTVSYAVESELGGSREIPLVLWYPTRAESGSRVTYFGFINRDNVFKGAEPAAVPDGLDGFPLMVFSHGSGGSPEQNWFLAEFMASHGWVVAAPGHVGNMFNDSGGSIAGKMFRLRPLDVDATLDYLLEGGAGDDPVGALISHETVVATGHSFGGYTSLAVSGATFAVDEILAACAAGQLFPDWCLEFMTYEDTYRAGFLDTRVDAIVPLAPGLTMTFGAGGAGDVAVPTLLMTGSRDATTPDFREGDPTWAALDGVSDLRVRFLDGGHFTFSNACEVAPQVGLNDGCGPDFTPPAEAHVAINAYSLAWLRRELGMAAGAGDAALLSGETVLRDDLEVVVP